LLGLTGAIALHLMLLVAVRFDMGRSKIPALPPPGETPASAVNIDLTPVARPHSESRVPTPPTARAILQRQSPTPVAPPHIGPADPQIAGARPPPAETTGERPQASVPAAVGDHIAPGLASALRGSIGCDHAGFLGLSDAEKRRCQQRSLARSGGAPETGIGINPEAQTEFDLAWRDDHTPQHPAYAKCEARFGLGQFKWNHYYRRIKLGPLPCYLVTPEAIVLPDKPKLEGN
jgi:hypothetical protein